MEQNPSTKWAQFQDQDQGQRMGEGLSETMGAAFLLCLPAWSGVSVVPVPLPPALCPDPMAGDHVCSDGPPAGAYG